MRNLKILDLLYLRFRQLFYSTETACLSILVSKKTGMPKKKNAPQGVHYIQLLFLSTDLFYGDTEGLNTVQYSNQHIIFRDFAHAFRSSRKQYVPFF